MIMFGSVLCVSLWNKMKNQLSVTYSNRLLLRRNWYRIRLRNRNRAWLRHWLWNRNTTENEEKYELVCNNRCTYIGWQTIRSTGTGTGTGHGTGTGTGTSYK
jgi:hypothetical protein